MTDVFTLGEALGIVTSGRIRHEAQARLDTGGAEMNVAIGLARLGHSVGWLGRVGADELGARILGDLRGERVDVRDAIVDDDAPTGLFLKETRAGLVTRVVYYRAGSAGSRLCAADVPDEVLSAARILHVTGITIALSASARDAVRTAVETARRAGVLVSADLNFRSGLWPSRDAAAGPFQELADDADLIFASEDELDLIKVPSSSELIVTRGGRGAEAYAGGRRHDAPGIPVPVVDTVGAGDSFVAGYLSGLLDGLPPEERLRRATVLGAFTVASPGDWQGLPTRAELPLLDLEEGVSLR